MKWIIGIDFHPRSQGALAYARFMHDTAPQDRFVAIHVVTPEHLMAALRYHHLDEVMKAARDAAHKVVEEAGCAQVCSEVRVVKGSAAAHRSLLEIAAEEGADGILVGRQATREGHQIVRLGTVTRRLLRETDRAVCVVPPDLELASVGTGPVLLLTRMTDDSVPAAHMAHALAERFGRKSSGTRSPYPRTGAASSCPVRCSTRSATNTAAKRTSACGPGPPSTVWPAPSSRCSRAASSTWFPRRHRSSTRASWSWAPGAFRWGSAGS